MELINQLKYNYKHGNLATRLIYINVGISLVVWLLQWMLPSTMYTVAAYTELPGEWSTFATRPWTLFTYMFLHGNPMHLLFNMFMLYVMAKMFYTDFSDRAFGTFYFLGGICGGLLFLLTAPLFYQYSSLVGASAAIYAVLFAMVAYRPNVPMRLLFIEAPFKLWHLAVGFLVLGFLLNTNNIGGNISHVGGALLGYFYMKAYERGNDFLGETWQKIIHLFTKEKRTNTRQKPPRDDYDYNDWKVRKQSRVDLILDKISRSGYSSLTDEEKEFLFKEGKH